MPIHKNVIRQKKATFTFNGTYIRRDFEDSSSYLGLPQDIWEAGTYPNLSIAENSLPLRFSGKAGGSFRVETAPGDEDSLIIMCMNETDDAYEYTAEEVRDNALAALQNTSGFNNASGLAYTPTQLGAWTEYDEVYSSDYTTYDLIWNPNAGNTAAFADDHPVGTDPVITHFINALDTGETFSTTFEPDTAVYSSSADEIELVFPESPSSTALTNKYWAVGGRFGSNTDSTDTPQWTAVVTSRAQDGNVTRVVMKVTSGSSFLNTTALAAPATSGANSIISLFTGGRQFVVYVSVTNLYMVDQINTANQDYTIEGLCTEADWLTVTAGVINTDQKILEINFTALGNINNNSVRVNGITAGIVNEGSPVNTIWFRQHPESFGYGGNMAFIGNNNADGLAASVAKFATNFNAGNSSVGTLKMVASVKEGDDTVLVLTPTLVSGNTGWEGDETVGNNGGSATFTFLDRTISIGQTESIADDPNRTGDNSGVLISNSSASSDHTTWAQIKFGRGASLTLSRGFKLNIGQGYDWVGDAKDGSLTLKENAQLAFSYENREDIWGGKDGVTPFRTSTNPFTVTKRTGGQIVMFHRERNRTGSGGQNVTFLNGENTAATGANLGSLIFNTDNAGTGFYASATTFYYPMPGTNNNNQVVADQPGGVTYYEPSPNVKQFDGDKVIHNLGFLNFNGSPGSYNVAAFDYASQWINCDMDFSGTVVDKAIADNVPLRAYQPRANNFYFVDVTRAGVPYVGDWLWQVVTPGIGTNGRARMARRWNPSWSYAGAVLSDIIESYYYLNNTETNLVKVKEGGESGAIGTAGTQTHPFNTGVTVGSTGLDDITLSNNLNFYSPGSTWGQNKPGICLTYLDGANPISDNHTDTLDEDRTTAFSYTRRDGFRPYFTSIDMRGDKSIFNPSTSMEALLDKYWQADTVSAIKVFTDVFETSAWSTMPVYTSGTNTLTVNLPVLTNGNNLHRLIEYSENNNKITNANLTSETRPFSTINGRFRRFIDTSVPVTTDGDINMPDYNLDLTYNAALVRSTGSDPIRGIDVGTTHTIKLTPGAGGENLIKLDLRAKSFTFDETNGDITSEDAVFTNVDAQTYPFDMETTVINSTGAPTLSGVTSAVTVNTNAATTVTGVSDDLIVNGTGAVSISANSTEGRYGTSSSKLASITYSSGAVSINDTGHTSGNLVLPNTNTDANFNVDGNISRAGTSGATTDATLTAAGSIEVNTIDGGNCVAGSTFRAHGSLVSTTIQATGNVTLDANATSSSGIGINGNAISIGGNTDGCEVNAVTTFTTNDVTNGSDVSAGTSAAVNDISAKVIAPIVTCDYIETGANITATTSIKSTLDMTGGTINSPTISLNDVEGGTVTSTTLLTVDTISGNATTITAEDMTLTRGE